MAAIVEEDHINCLPDELMVLIFDKLSEAKCLCNCSLVSKRFASVILKTHTVSIEIRNWDAVSEHLNNPNPTNYNVSLIQTIKFLKSFSSIQSLCIQVFPSAWDHSLVKWKFGSTNGMPVFVILAMKSLSTATTHGHNKEDDNVELDSTVVSRSTLVSRTYLASYHMLGFRARWNLFRLMADNNLIVRNVVITDSKKEGRISIGEEQLVELMNPKPPPPPPLLVEGCKSVFNLWYVPVLRLPLSGCVMKELTLGTVKAVDGTTERKSDDDNDNGDNYVAFEAADVFEGEEKAAFDEAVMEMLKKNPSFSTCVVL